MLSLTPTTRLRARVALLASATLLARAAHAQSSQVLPDASSVGITQFELQRSLLEIDEQRRRLEVSLEPVDSVLRVLVRDSIHVATMTRPAAVDRDVDVVRSLARQLRATPNSPDLESRFAAAVSTATNDFSVADHALGARVVSGPSAQETLARSPIAAIVALDTTLPPYDTSLWEKLRRADAGQPLAPITDTDVRGFQFAVSDTGFAAYRNALLEALGRRMTDVRQAGDQRRTDVQRLRTHATQLAHTIGAQEQGAVQLDSRLIAVALPVFAVVVLIVLLAPRVYRSPELQAYIFTSGLLLEITTLVLIVGAVLALGLGGRVHAETIGTLLGALGGFLLGRAVPRRGLEIVSAPMPMQDVEAPRYEPAPAAARPAHFR